MFNLIVLSVAFDAPVHLVLLHELKIMIITIKKKKLSGFLFRY